MELQPSELRHLNRIVDGAHARFNRVLVTWAGDVLELRRRNRLVPQWADSPNEVPAGALSQGAPKIEPMTAAWKSPSNKAA